MLSSARLAVIQILQAIDQGAFADIALQGYLDQQPEAKDRRLMTELVYGIVRRQRTLDHLMTQLAHRPANEQSPQLRHLLRLGLYQLRYLNQIPPHAAIHTTVDLAKHLNLGRLSKVVNAVLRQYLRLASTADPLQVDNLHPVRRLGILHSFPDWMVQVWQAQIGLAQTEALCRWFNQRPTMDLRLHPRRSSVAQMQHQLAALDIASQPLPQLPQALRILNAPGRLTDLPGFTEGAWVVQDASAQLVGYMLDPQPEWRVLDMCAAPGGKTVHLAELMENKGQIWACEKAKSRIKRIQENLDRLQVSGVHLWQGDGRSLPATIPQVDAALVDAPCSGLGTLHRHVDARWRQTPDSVQQLRALQLELLNSAAGKVKAGGLLVYSTCTLHPAENEQVVDQFLVDHPHWSLENPPSHSPARSFLSNPGILKIWPHRQEMDGFFVARFRQHFP
ncbi:16S rRNA (cytosine(967)-C(5))-methyltransferase [Lyngbya confervoides]|uniref:16S rRNA (cytosine(967)-C(5))-methyltransferase n=1 Tax=Lyngbya confervoides BDU141951 TaxID=1574623 RepID=A0ABD4T5Y6_9CYAN|nr:16S rRNA (cytosine(967)-C(5))-methyltransferase [Lyngbya confervoides]MCM1984099.1 16S rRNA (cytosine(967)-C(5))-methyltransferase [Lyngbya confervoides BDU141951]